MRGPSTNQQVSRYKQTTPFRAAPPPPKSVTTQPVSYYKPTTPFRAAPPSSFSTVGRVAKFLSKLPKGGGAALAIALELLFPPPAGDNYYDRNPKNPPPKYKLHPSEPPQEVQKPVPPPFNGGQTRDKQYLMRYMIHVGNGHGNVDREVEDEVILWGAIVGTYIDYSGFTANNNWGATQGVLGTSSAYGATSLNPKRLPIGGYQPALTEPKIKIISLTRIDGQPDTGGDLPPLAPPIYSTPGNSLGAPSAAPPSAAPSPLPGAPGISGSPGGSPSGAPGGFPGSLPGGSPGGSPSGAPGGFPSPAPAPNPRPAPQPNKYPGPAPEPSPAPAPNGDPGPSPGPGVEGPAPNPTPSPSGAPAPSGYRSPSPADPTKYPDTGYQPNIFRANPLVAAPAPAPNPLKPQKFIPNPNTGDPEPKAPPLVKAPTTPSPTPTPNEDLGEKIRNWLGPIAIATAGITALVQPNALRSAANAGTCDAFAPSGCNAPIANNAQAAANNSANNNVLLAQILAFLQALQAAFMVPILAGVNLINTKLGPVMSGINGIGGFLSRTAEAAKLDKVLNAMNTVLLLHNAAMLSRNLGSTLGDLTSQALATIGIKDGDSPIDVNEILGKQANNFMAGVLGAEVWAGTKTSWNKASSIIASATNLMYTVHSMFDSSREILEWTAENTGKIGNALKRFRIVGENAYKWLPERVTVQNRFTQRLDKIREGTDSLDDAASSLSGVLGEVQSIQSEYADLQEQKQKFDANIKDLTPKTREENKPVSDSVVAAKTASIAPAGIENVFRGEGSTTDA